MDKKGPQSFNRDLISHSFLQLFWDFDYWLLNRGRPLNRWPLHRGLTKIIIIIIIIMIIIIIIVIIIIIIMTNNDNSNDYGMSSNLS